MFPELNCLRELTILSIFARFSLSTICSAIIGYERSKSHHEAGLRTHILVCIGAASVMILSQYLSACANSDADPARLGAQVISGIGFLGAGTIVITGYQQGQRVRGLTTAAGLWASACMGLVIGSGFYEAAVIMCAFLACIIIGLNRIEGKYLKDLTVIRLYLEYSTEIQFSTIHVILRSYHCHLARFDKLFNSSHINGVIVDAQCSELNTDKKAMIEELRNTSGVLFADEI